MKKTRKINRLLLSGAILLGLAAAGCGVGGIQAGFQGVDKEQAAVFGDDGWTVDHCREMGWYGDGECDVFCPQPDPDCQPASDQTHSCGGHGYEVAVYQDARALVLGGSQQTLHLASQPHPSGLPHYLSDDGQTHLLLNGQNSSLEIGGQIHTIDCRPVGSDTQSQGLSWNGDGPLGDWSHYGCNGFNGPPVMNMNLLDYEDFIIPNTYYDTMQQLHRDLGGYNGQVEATIDFSNTGISGLSKVALTGTMNRLQVALSGSSSDGRQVSITTNSAEADSARFELKVRLNGNLVESRLACVPNWQGFLQEHISNGCLPSEFDCGNGTCLPASWECDGYADCPSGIDEESCQISCLPSEFDCGNGTCLPASWECDGWIDCPSGEDENC